MVPRREFLVYFVPRRKFTLVSRKTILVPRKEFIVSRRKYFVAQRQFTFVSRKVIFVPRKEFIVSRRKYFVPRRKLHDPEKGLWTARSCTWSILQCCAVQITRPSWLYSGFGKVFLLKILFTPSRNLKKSLRKHTVHTV